MERLGVSKNDEQMAYLNLSTKLVERSSEDSLVAARAYDLYAFNCGLGWAEIVDAVCAWRRRKTSRAIMRTSGKKKRWMSARSVSVNCDEKAAEDEDEDDGVAAVAAVAPIYAPVAV